MKGPGGQEIKGKEEWILANILSATDKNRCVWSWWCLAAAAVELLDSREVEERRADFRLLPLAGTSLRTSIMIHCTQHRMEGAFLGLTALSIAPADLADLVVLFHSLVSRFGHLSLAPSPLSLLPI